MDRELTYDEALSKSAEWQRKATQASSGMLKSALEAVAQEYANSAAAMRAKWTTSASERARTR
jgi:hypothetical protein